jgi:hypothetical protein
MNMFNIKNYVSSLSVSTAILSEKGRYHCIAMFTNCCHIYGPSGVLESSAHLQQLFCASSMHSIHGLHLQAFILFKWSPSWRDCPWEHMPSRARRRGNCMHAVRSPPPPPPRLNSNTQGRSASPEGYTVGRQVLFVSECSPCCCRLWCT